MIKLRSERGKRRRCIRTALGVAFSAAVILGAAPLSGCRALTPATTVPSASVRVERLLAEAPLIDGHNDLMYHFHACRDGCPRGPDGYDIVANASGQTDIARWRRGGVGAQLLNAGWLESENDLDGTLKGFAFVRELVALHGDRLQMARNSAEVRAAQASGRIAILLGLEDPGPLGSDEATIRRLAAEGLRSDILAYSGPTPLADGHAGPALHGGLSPLGRDVVRWMQEDGILVDLSHASADTARDVLDVSIAPVIFSHSAAAALCGVSRNVPDDVLRRMPANGGMVMVSFAPEHIDKSFADWMERGDLYWENLRKEHGGDREKMKASMASWEKANPTPVVSLGEVADHVEHIRALAGIDHVGIGGDFDGIEYTVSGLEDVSTYPRLLEELAKRGWRDADLRKLASENFLRVLDAADAVREAQAKR